ncbi:MAG: tyrosine-type recombinase/integrase [Kangiella sp.]|nr:tyrosine-type recombinase/integrase [Kangiella sp.]
MPLTDIQIKKLKPKDKEYKKSDGHGLFIIISPNGKKRWRKKYYFNGKERSFTIGDYPAISLREARIKRAEIEALLNEGQDPSLVKMRNSSGKPTFYEVAKEWWEHNSGFTVKLMKQENYDHRELVSQVNERIKAWDTKHAVKVWKRLEKYVLKVLGSYQISDIKATDVRIVLERIIKQNRYEVPRKVLQHINGIFDFALIDNRVELNPCYGLKKLIPNYKTEHRKSLPINELPEFFKALNNSKSDPATILAIKFLILTCVRSKELRYAEWHEFDFDNKLWTIPAARMKSKRIHKVPLTEQMLELLEKIKELSSTSRYLFPSIRAKDGVIGENTLNVAIDRIGYKGKVTPHGFRATAKTAWIEAGYSDMASELQLAHVDKNQVRGAYNYNTELIEERRIMVEWYSKELIHSGIEI